MILAITTSVNIVLNITVDSWPVKCESSSCLRLRDSLMPFMKVVEHCCTKVGWDEETTSMYNEVIVDCEMIFDTPKLLLRSRQGGFLVGETSCDELFEILIFLIFVCILPQLLKVQILWLGCARHNAS